MKNKRILATLLITAVLVLGSSPAIENGHFVTADTIDGETLYPYTQTFTISAYYSPLPCQARYATGSYSSDIRLNGGGVRGADGTPVYPGMVAAPKTYTFGTKMYIPGIGIVGVHDRGGAIVTAGNRGQSYDRLDIWMGYGDKGLKRALSWGKRTVDVTIYGITDAVTEDVALDGYSPEEAIPNDCSEIPETLYAEAVNDTVSAASTATQGLFSYNMEKGSSGDVVTKLQEELGKLNYYEVDPSGVYDDMTVHAVFKFQQARGIIEDQNDSGAGVFGPKTRSEVNKIVSNREFTLALIADTTAKVKSVAGAENL